MLTYLINDGEIKNIEACSDIEASKTKKLNMQGIDFYTLNSLYPLKDYVQFNYYTKNRISVTIRTLNEAFLVEVFSKISNLLKNNVVNIITPYKEIYTTKSFKETFKNVQSALGEMSVFGCYAKEDISILMLPPSVTIKLASKSERKFLSKYSYDEWEDIESEVVGRGQDSLLLLLYEDDNLAGYLGAFRYYKDFFVIGNVFVHKNYRGKKYGCFLTVAFAEHCYKNSITPYLGTACTAYSEAIAKKCGFTEVEKIFTMDQI